MAKTSSNIREPSILVKPISKFGGLDNIHIALIVLVVILILLVVAISFNTKITFVNQTSGANCTSGSSNSTCATAHTSAQVKLFAEKVLAGYANYNSSLSLLPYISNISAMTEYYIPSSGYWYVSVPYNPPNQNKTYPISMLISDKNLTLLNTFFQGVPKPLSSSNYVPTKGVVKLAQQTSCSYGKPLQIYWFIDPYAPGAIQGLTYAARLENKLGARVNITPKILFTQYSQSIANTYGVNNTLTLGKYIFCGSMQKNFTGFINALNASYPNTYMQGYIIQGIAAASKFNIISLNACIASSQSAIAAQTVLARYYNVTSSSTVLTDCQYLSLPSTTRQAACYANSTLC